MHKGDITECNFLANLFQKEKPEKLYHFAAQSFVGYGFQNELSTYDANIGATINLCNAPKDSLPGTQMYFVATLDLFRHLPEHS